MKLLICDDDISTVDVIQNQIDWNALGITRILRAYNGTVAKEIILKENPELVLCDVEMPQCNGIEVLKYVSENGIHTNFAFLTCYESFEYAREAVRYGAVNYLTKPLDLEELTEALKKMVEDVHRARVEEAQKEDCSNREVTMLNSFLRSLRDGFYGTDPQRIDAVLRRERINLPVREPWRQVLLGVNMDGAYEQGWTKELAHYSFRFLAGEAISDRLDFGYSIVDAGTQFYTVLLLIPAARMTEVELQQRCQRFVHICMVHMQVCPVCLISEPDSLYRLSETNAEVSRKLHKLRFREGQVFLDSEITEDTFRGAAFEVDYVRLMSCVKKGNKEDYTLMVAELLDKIIQSRTGSDRQMALLHHDLLQCFYTLLRDNKIQAHELFHNNEMRDRDYYAERSVNDMKKYAYCLFDSAVSALEKENGSSDMIAVVKQYIKEHFREDIDRNEVATVAYITPNYLSKRFRSETGMSLREYINELRINEAKRLLLSTGKTVSEIACEVGFENISYFSTVFHKHCAMSPIEWREKSGNNK